MTRKVFWADPYETRHVTTVESVAGQRVTLVSTVFFAFSGGQESDQGTIEGIPVLDAHRDGPVIRYTLPEAHGLIVGQEVTIVIDWVRRYRLMRLHFAAELVLEIVCRRIPRAKKIGAHIAPQKSRIDFACDAPVTALLPAIADEANAIVAAAQPITSDFEDIATERRYWEIEGFSRVPCGGTHLRRTDEVGTIRLRRQNVGRGKERIEITVSD